VDDVWTLVRFLHLLGVAAWLGGMLFLGLVVVPVVRASGGMERWRALVTAVARRFAVVGGVAWGVILVTGLALLHHRGLGPGDLTDSGHGRRVLTKLVLLVLVGVAVLVHGLVQGPRVRRAESDGDPAARRRWAIAGGILDASMLLATLAALWLGASLVA
jgi:putative copper export protein